MQRRVSAVPAAIDASAPREINSAKPGPARPLTLIGINLPRAMIRLSPKVAHVVEATLDAQLQQAQLILRPNRSWSWHANLMLLASLAALSLTIASGFLWHGIWLVLPFTLLELSALYLCLRYLVRRDQLQEVITFSADQVVIERGRHAVQECHTFSRYWAHFCVVPAALPGYDKRIAIRSHGKEQEIGRFLSAADKQDLVDHLRAIVAAFQRITSEPRT